MPEQTPTEDNPNAQLDIERLTARAIAQEKYITLADKHIALLEGRLRSVSASHIGDQQRMSAAMQNAAPGTPYGDAMGIIR